MIARRVDGATLRAIDPARDLDAVARLHAQCFADDPWDKTALARLLELPGCIGLVAEVGSPDGGNGQSVGFILLQVAVDQAEILTIGVDPSWRGGGLGAALLGHAAVLAAARGARALFLEVAEDNAEALALYQRVGFRPSGRRRGYYRRRSGGAVDALVLTRKLEVD